MLLCITQIQDAMAGQEKRIEDNVNAETRQTGAGLGDELLKQIKLSAPDAVETARLKEMEADVAQIRRDIDAIKVQLKNNQPACGSPLMEEKQTTKPRRWMEKKGERAVAKRCLA